MTTTRCIQSRPRFTLLLVCFAALQALSLDGCSTQPLEQLSTDTGNPPVVDIGKVSSRLKGDTLIVTGAEGAADPGGKRVTLTNSTTGQAVSTLSNADGSFSLEISGSASDEFELSIAGGEGPTTLPATTASARGASSPPAEDLISDPPPELIQALPARSNAAPVPTKDGGSETREPDVHRPMAETCDDVTSLRPTASGDCTLKMPGECCSDADCTGAGGRCVNNGGNAYYCDYDTCALDSDCTGGGPCVCAGTHNACKSGNCQTDGDCGNAAFCSPTTSQCRNFGIVAYYCHTEQDECHNDSDCTAPAPNQSNDGTGACFYSAEVSHWKCTYSTCFD